jgi:hypothetical protein
MEMNPIFKLVLGDKGWNYYETIPKGWLNFKAVIDHPDPAVDVNIELSSEPFQNGLKFEINNNPLLITKFRNLAYRTNYFLKITCTYKPN